ncbi:hypothetical protein ADN00_15745 [Ornatilinea apprima]|uniref:Uncharacterized protein n=1 Tax=Ornatilinea apprima TaxID=1134406 RepID=A0A0P6XRI0_9CHLR|nr:hypothetical protein ADN00_15745 [Ornatilinea apprima]
MDLNQKKINPINNRPICPVCGSELVLTLIVFGNVKYHAWLCDCATQPEDVAADIVRAREFAGEVLLYTVEYVRDEGE